MCEQDEKICRPKWVAAGILISYSSMIVEAFFESQLAFVLCLGTGLFCGTHGVMMSRKMSLSLAILLMLFAWGSLKAFNEFLNFL